VDNKVLMMESRTLFIEASTPEPDENSQVLNQIEFTRCTGRRGLPDTAATRSALVEVRKIAWLMDSSIPIGGGYRIGIDGLIDFVPGIGDVAGVLVSAYIIYRAAACGAPQPVLMRMAGNVLMDALLGAFPILGVVADSAFKANIRNAAIFEEFLRKQERSGTVIDVEPSFATK
jgi:hypothetical protein